MEVAAGVAGFASLAFQCFQGCVQAFDFFYTAQNIGPDGDSFAAKLVWEQYQLIQWGQKAGLDRQTRSDRLNWELACTILQQLRSLLTSADKLKQKYHLEIAEEDVEQWERSAAANAPSKGIGKLIARLRPETYTIKGQIIHASNRPLKRLRWATFGREQANTIIQEIESFNKKLYGLLDSVDRDMQAQVNAVLLRDILSRSSNAAQVDLVQQILEPTSTDRNESIKSAAVLKQIRLYIGNETRGDETQTQRSAEMTKRMPAIGKYKPRKLKPYYSHMPLRYKGFELARYDGEPVLMEWKTAVEPLWQGLYDQIRCLATLLASPAAKKAQALRCIATLPWQERELLALVYEIPQTITKTARNTLQLKSMYHLIQQKPSLSLTRRFEFAKLMTEAVLHLHTAGWLHKSLRSENIVFFATEGAPLADFLSSQPYLIGYEYSRLDSSQAAAFTQLPDTELAVDLYRHPQARGVQRERYRKQFDMYALGCILIEIALWQTLLDVKTSFVDATLSATVKEATALNKDVELPSLLHFRTQQQLIERLQHSVGDSFVDAISICLTTDDTGKEDSDVSLDVHEDVIRKLHECRC